MIVPHFVSNFSNGVNIPRLKKEISLSSIRVGIVDIKDFTTRIDIEFVDKLNNTDISSLNTILEDHDGAPIQDFQYIESEGESQTTSTAYVEKIKLTTLSLSSGDYLINYSCECSITLGAADVEIRVDLNDGTIIGEHKFDSTAGDELNSFSGFKKVTLSAGVHTIDIDFKTELAVETAKIKRARVSIQKL